MTWGAAAKRYTVALSVCVAASGISAMANASTPSTSGAATAPKLAASAPAGGMYGELSGAPSKTVPQMRIRPSQNASASQSASQEAGYDGNAHAGNTRCSVYANSVGMGSHCSSGGGTAKSLLERFPGMQFENCRYETPPDGVDVPRNPSPGEKKWVLRTCLTAINWHSYNGGPQRRFMMDLVLVDDDFDMRYRDTPLSDFLWNNVQTTYPIPMLRVEPKTFPVVGQDAFFTFNWLDAKSRKPHREGPYADSESGGPYVTRTNYDMFMRARARSMRIKPLVSGMKAKTCRPGKLGYQENRAPTREQQRSNCYFVFKRSSAADSMNESENNPGDDKNAFRIEITVRWIVEYGERGGDMQQLGDGYDMLLFQSLPVMDSEALNVPLPESELL